MQRYAEIWRRSLEINEESGLHCLLIGAESGLDETLQLLNKDASVDGYSQIKRKTAKYNIKLHLSLM